MAEHNNDYRIVLEPGHVMKGSRVDQQHVEWSSTDDTDGQREMSGEPILRPFTSGSRNSNAHSVSPTFDVGNFSASPGAGQQHGDDAAALRAIMGGTALTNGGDSRAMTSANIVFPKACEQILFPSADTLSGVFALEIVKVLQRWYRCHGWPTNFNLVTIPESFRA